MDQNNRPLRTIRSFVKREGRLTEGQKRILMTSPYLIQQQLLQERWDLDALFGRSNQQRTLEIGFGNGRSLIEMAEHHPERDFLGVEVHRPGVGHLLMGVAALGLTNVRAIDYDAVHLIDHCFADTAFDCVQIFFPDPWHKKKHNKRRIIQSEFIGKLTRILQPEGKIHLATDWQPYAEHMLEVLNAHGDYENLYNGYAPRPEDRPLTKFELRGEKLGHGVWDLIFSKQLATSASKVIG